MRSMTRHFRFRKLRPQEEQEAGLENVFERRVFSDRVESRPNRRGISPFSNKKRCVWKGLYYILGNPPSLFTFFCRYLMKLIIIKIKFLNIERV